jgi:XRE family transcriptional regulator of biofilm formation
MGKRTVSSKETNLGAAIKQLRQERGLSAYRLSQDAGLSRSYMSYLEKGDFSEIGLDKFVRLVQALGVSADQLLTEAGYLPKAKAGAPDIKGAIRASYKLSPKGVEEATTFLEFLALREKKARKK